MTAPAQPAPQPDPHEATAKTWLAATPNPRGAPASIGFERLALSLAALLREREAAAERSGAKAMRLDALRRLDKADPGPVYKMGGALVLDAFDYCKKLIAALPLPGDSPDVSRGSGDAA